MSTRQHTQPPQPGPYRLLRNAPPPARALRPDAAQQAVLDHGARAGSGPLLVLAGPGTGKTTTLVELVARRVEAGLRADEVLVLTFSRKAAGELRDQITARLGTPTAGPSAWTFHAFCYALLREHAPPDAYGVPVRLLSGPEQDVALRELLRGSLELGRAWPESLRPAVTTRGFAEEVRGLLSRAREVGLDPDQLGALAVREGRGDWAALSSFFGEYLDVLDAQGALDYAELVHRAVLLAERPDVADQLRGRFAAVVVDEYQDTDPAQERLLQALAGGGRDLVAVGDPDQAIYAFRGAEVRGLLDFPDRFPTTTGAPAPVLALTTCRRSGEALLEVSRRVAARIPAPGLPVDQLRPHRELRAAEGAPPGDVEVHTHPSVGAEADAVADLLRREHLERGTPWSRMAVLVRSGARSVPLLRRVLTAAGVPLDVAGDELPLGQEPAVAPLLLALRVAADPTVLTAEAARQLLLSPLGGADPGALRRLGRDLRALDRLANERDPDAPSRLPAPSADLLREAVADPRSLVVLDPAVVRSAVRLAALLAAARRVLPDGPEAALWELWSGSAWPTRLESASLSGGAAGRAADRDLDAVVALFSLVGRAQEQRPALFAPGTGHDPGKGVAALLDEIEAQRIPGDTLSETGVRGESVRLLTAHRSKGLEWDVVVVTGVQEGVWPDLRRRSTLLETERLGGDELREPTDRASLLADERRLFYVALTRARRRLVVTAVDSPDDDGERPSRLLAETGVEVRQHLDRVARPLSLPSLVATLRRRAVDPRSTPAMRRAAAARLARLTVAVDDTGAPLAPAASPDRWWGLVETTTSEHPVLGAGEPVRLSGTSLSGLDECPLRWFLEHEVHADSPASTAMGFGGVLHALAHEVATGQTPPELDVLMTRLDKVWSQLAYDAPWQSRQQHDEARAALQRFLIWHSASRGRTLVATEIGFDVPVEAGSGEHAATVRLRGYMDRVELDEDGRVHVVDLKTGKSAPGKKDLETHAQLGTYQLAVREGALDEHVATREVGGAELVMLRLDGPDGPKVPQQPALPPGRSWVEDLLDAAVRRVLTESFPPSPQERCDRCAFRRACPAQPDGRQVVE
ncbi:MAG: ATP-dependent DNA helicase [Mycobacteriales bacterium]|nr:ATP-dependent DNA helicase [Mycobacteriales bacterium]